jgi:hypothetical protein
VAEQLADAEQIEHRVVVDDLDRPVAHDAQVLGRLRSLGEDRRPGEVELDLGGEGDPLDVGALEGVERRMGAEEVDDVGERGSACPRILADHHRRACTGPGLRVQSAQPGEARVPATAYSAGISP